MIKPKATTLQQKDCNELTHTTATKAREKDGRRNKELRYIIGILVMELLGNGMRAGGYGLGWTYVG